MSNTIFDSLFSKTSIQTDDQKTSEGARPHVISNRPVFMVDYHDPNKDGTIIPELIISETNILDTMNLSDQRERMDEQHNRIIKIKTDMRNEIKRLEHEVNNSNSRNTEMTGNPFGSFQVNDLDAKKKRLSDLRLVINTTPLCDPEYRAAFLELFVPAVDAADKQLKEITDKMSSEIIAFQKQKEKHNSKMEKLRKQYNDIVSEFSDATIEKYNHVINGTFYPALSSIDACKKIETTAADYMTTPLGKAKALIGEALKYSEG